MARILSIWLPQLPLDRLIRRGDPRVDGPFAVVADIKNATRLAHLSDHARKAGLSPGLSIPDARAICPDLLTEPADPLRENNLLRALWRWADHFSPRVALDAPDGLFLDIAGCAHLFGGEPAMGRDVIDRLSDMQIVSRVGIADTKRAARGLARFGGNLISIAETGRTFEALKGLPIAALGISEKTNAELAQSGLKTIAQLYEIKSSELARRFGLELTNAFGASIGQAPDPVTPAAADPIYAARMTLPDPIGFLIDIENVLQRLSEAVCARLKDKQKGARRFHLTVRCVDTGDHHLTVGFAKPCFDVGPILQQFARPLDQLKIEFGADWFRLTASNIEPICFRQTHFEDTAKAEDSFARTISTIGNKVGFDHVRRFENYNSHLPEREHVSIEVVDRNDDPVWKRVPRRRPVRLYKHPEWMKTLEPGRPPRRFEWRRKAYDTKSAKGPERLTPEWWRDGDMRVRDYWTVQTENGLRLWLLTYPSGDPPQWYVAGRFP